MDEDDVTQFLIEEAIGLYFNAVQHAEHQVVDAAASGEPARKPGEIVDPVMVAAMAEAKRMHREQFGEASVSR